MATFVEDEFVKSYREKHREQCNRWYEENRKKSASKPKPKLMQEEKRERCRQRAHEYYVKNKKKYLASKHKWYHETRDYALNYQYVYDKGVRIGEKRKPKKSKKNLMEDR